MVANNKPTNYLNAKGRRIFKGPQGGFFARAADGSKVYKPKAAFRKAGSEGAQVKITKTRNNTAIIPTPLRPKATKAAVAKPKGGPRKVRSNKGVSRGVRSGTLQRRMNAEAARLAARRRAAAARRRALAGGNKVTTRKARSNKGVTRGPAGPRKARANAGVKRGPQAGVLQRRMNAAAKRAAAKRAAGPVVRKPRTNKGVKRGMRTPTEAALYQMIFGPEKKAVKAVKAMIVSPGGTTYKSKAAAARRKKTVKKKKAASAKTARRSPMSMMLRSGRAKK